MIPHLSPIAADRGRANGFATAAFVLRIEPLFGVSTKGFNRLSQRASA